MSLLTICQNVATNCGFPQPALIIGNPDTTAAMLLALINKGGKRLARKPWQVLRKEYTFSTAIGTPSYALPSDYGWFENDTAWDRTMFWKMRGSLSAEEWQRYKSGVMSTTPRARFRIKNNLIFIDPTPTAIDSLVIEYISKKWVFDGASTYYPNFQNDGWTSLIDEDLIELELTWRFLNRKGLAYAEERDELERQLDIIFAHDVPKDTVNQATRNEPWPPLPTVPITGYS